jgi:hypothetical protein
VLCRWNKEYVSKISVYTRVGDQRLDGGLRTRLSTIEDEIGQMRRDVKVCVVHIKLTNMPIKIYQHISIFAGTSLCIHRQKFSNEGSSI